MTNRRTSWNDDSGEWRRIEVKSGPDVPVSDAQEEMADEVRRVNTFWSGKKERWAE